jgi:hypothetical protein
MVLVLPLDDVYRESILGFASQKVLADERIALVSPIIVSTRFSVLPGFAPAGELVAWRVPKGATIVWFVSKRETFVWSKRPENQ